MSRLRDLLLIIGVMLWTAALLPSWNSTEDSGVIHKRFCLGWWNSPLLEANDRIDESETSTFAYSGATSFRVFSWSAFALVLGTLSFVVRDRLKSS